MPAACLSALRAGFSGTFTDADLARLERCLPASIFYKEPDGQVGVQLATAGPLAASAVLWQLHCDWILHSIGLLTKVRVLPDCLLATQPDQAIMIHPSCMLSWRC